MHGIALRGAASPPATRSAALAGPGTGQVSSKEGTPDTPAGCRGVSRFQKSKSRRESPKSKNQHILRSILGPPIHRNPHVGRSVVGSPSEVHATWSLPVLCWGFKARHAGVHVWAHRPGSWWMRDLPEIGPSSAPCFLSHMAASINWESFLVSARIE